MFYSGLKSTTRIQWAAPAAEYKPFRSLVARSIIAPEGRISSCDLTNKTTGRGVRVTNRVVRPW